MPLFPSPLPVDAQAYYDLLGMSVWPDVPQGGTLLPLATMVVAKIPLRSATSITNVVAHLTANAVTPTHSFGGILKSDGTFIGRTVDYATNWVSAGASIDGNAGGTGVKAMVLSGGPFTATPLAANDFIWAFLYCGTAGTAPTFLRQAGFSSLATNFGLATARFRAATIAQADTATPGTIVPGNLVAAANLYALGIS